MSIGILDKKSIHAIFYFKLAAAQGNVKSQKYLGIIYYINGFRLVKADSYKKLWQTERIACKTSGSFEVWMKNLTGTKRTWDYKQKQWDTGKINHKYDEKQGWPTLTLKSLNKMLYR